MAFIASWLKTSYGLSSLTLVHLKWCFEVYLHLFSPHFCFSCHERLSQIFFERLLSRSLFEWWRTRFEVGTFVSNESSADWLPPPAANRSTHSLIAHVHLPSQSERERVCGGLCVCGCVCVHVRSWVRVIGYVLMCAYVTLCVSERERERKEESESERERVCVY